MEFTPEQSAYIEGLVNRTVQKQIANLAIQMQPAGTDWKSEDWDFKAEPANMYPGNGWFFCGFVTAQPGTVVIMWRKSRAVLAAERTDPVMKIPPK